MRVAFAGTPPFARAALAALHAAGHEIVLVMTQPDRPAGRGMKLAASPVKAFALQHSLPLAQPRGLRVDGRFAEDAGAARDALRAAHADVLVVAAYGLILPTWTLELPRLGALNIHASLLPRWRGAAPIQRAIEAGDARTGITIMQMDAGLDTGAMLCAEATPIGHGDTSASLHERLADIGARLIVEALPLLGQGRLPPTTQPAEGATYARKIEKSEAAVDWTAPAWVLERRLRAFDPFPGASSRLGDESLKLWRGEVTTGHGAPGEIVAIEGGSPVVACGEAALRVTELQRPGGRRLAAPQALASLNLAPGMRFRTPD